MMRFVNTALPSGAVDKPDVLGVLSAMVLLFVVVAEPGEVVRLWILGGVEFRVPLLWTLGVTIAVNLVVRGVVGWWRKGNDQAEKIFDEELGQ